MGKFPSVLLFVLFKFLRVRLPSWYGAAVDSLLPFIAEALPPEIAARFQPLTVELVALGFCDPVHYFVHEPEVGGKFYMTVFRHSSGQHTASIFLNVWPRAKNSDRYVRASIATGFTDGTALVSSTDEAGRTPDSLKMNCVYQAGIPVLWTSHRQWIAPTAERKTISPIHTREELIAKEERWHKIMHAFQRARGVYRKRSPGREAKADQRAVPPCINGPAGRPASPCQSAFRKILIFAVILIAVFAIRLITLAPSIQRSFFYPKPPGLPPVVDQATGQWLARLQAVLETNAPVVAQALQPGLTDAQIAALEKQDGFHLSENLKTLYRWHNGMATNSPCGLLPGQRFLPLDEFIRQREALRQQEASLTLAQRAFFKVFAGHKRNWIHVLDDGATDGYFYDPERAEVEGAFFYNMAETGYYVWFPSLNNFLAGVIEGYESGAFKVSSDGKKLEEDDKLTEKIWSRLAKSNESKL